MVETTIKITIRFREGADVQDEAYRFRQVFVKHNIVLKEETYTKNSVTYTIECTVSSIGAITSLLDNKSLDVDDAVVDITLSQDQQMIPIVGTVKA
ncbi:hypothetical protein [Ruminococcus sp. JL13D9]|uniref:hypothetical protein n=1 Tax=Ruminococcus sp. JL13D9 TaxID=3233381 RepID=UPI00389AC667